MTLIVPQCSIHNSICPVLIFEIAMENMMMILWLQILNNQQLILNDDLEMDYMDYYGKTKHIHATSGIVIKNIFLSLYLKTQFIYISLKVLINTYKVQILKYHNPMRLQSPNLKNNTHLKNHNN